MALSYAGVMPITSLCPTLNTALGNASIGMAASYNGAVSVEATFTASPPTLASVLEEMSSFEGDISAAITAGNSALSFSVSDCATLTSNLNTALSTLPTLQGLLGAAIGIMGFTYTGAGNALGAALTSQLATQWPDGTSSSGSCTALVFGTVVNASLTPSNISTTQFESFLSGLTFGSGLVYAGEKLTLSGLCPAVSPAMPQATGAINAQLAAAASLSVSLSVQAPTLPASLTNITAAAGRIEALPPPSLVVSASAALAASLSSSFGALIALGNILSRNDAVAFVYEYTGAGNALGAAVTSALTSTWGDGTTSTSGACTAVILGAVDTLTANTMLSFFGGA